jgi:hypothetical protein
MRHSLRRISIAIALATLLAACDPGYSFWFRNQSEGSVIVQFIDPTQSGTGFLLRPGQTGGWFVGLGSAWIGHVRVVQETCSLTWEGDINSSSGGIDIATNGSVRFVGGGPGTQPASTIQLPIHLASETGSCLPAGIDFQPNGG